MRLSLIVLALASLAEGANAQVAVIDAAREKAEQGVAKCMTTANASRFATVSPTKGTQGSVAAPGAANAAATSAVGGADLTGGAGAGLATAANAGASASTASNSAGSGASGAASLAGSGASNSGQGTGAVLASSATASAIGGVNLNGLADSRGASLSLGDALQIFKAVSGVSTALQNNSAALTDRWRADRLDQCRPRRLRPELRRAHRPGGKLERGGSNRDDHRAAAQSNPDRPRLGGLGRRRGDEAKLKGLP